MATVTAPQTATPAASQTTTPAASQTSSASGTAAARSRTSAGADFETFLTLLTTQLKNQDPLQPMESTEFVAQLATFSSVEQQVKSNEKLEAILDALTAGPGVGLAEWIGKEVRAVAATRFDGETAVDLYARPVAGADLAVLVVKDKAGKEVARITVDAKATELSWDGAGTTGTLPAGDYSFSTESYKGKDLLAKRPVELYAEVAEVRRDGLDTFLVLQGGTVLNSADVTGMRLPAPAED